MPPAGLSLSRPVKMRHQSEAEVSTIARAAMSYCAARWSVLPLRPHDKRPLIDWERFQNERASPATVAEWHWRWPDADVGIVTGESLQARRPRH